MAAASGATRGSGSQRIVVVVEKSPYAEDMPQILVRDFRAGNPTLVGDRAGYMNCSSDSSSIGTCVNGLSSGRKT